MSDRKKSAKADAAKWRPRTRLVRGGLDRTKHRETSEAVFLTSGYVYAEAAEAEEAFAAKDSQRFVYSRFGNPTVAAFEERLRLFEGAEACRATATGMAAVFAALMSQVRAGDRVVASRALFGSCSFIISDLLPRYGVATQFVDGTDLDQWKAALAKPARAVFLETPSNPMLDVIDLEAVAELAHRAGARVVVDNVFAIGAQRPLERGADVVVYSATKHIDGQGRTLGGAVLGRREFVETELQPFLRHTGPALSPFNAWVLLKGLETLPLRIDRHVASAERVARHFEGHPKLDSVRYPFLDSHPQSALARRQMKAGGTIVCFDIAGGKEGAFRFLDALSLVDISNNLGDAKSLVTHPATTTHQRLSPEDRARQGIGPGLVRLSVGLEDVDDIIEDVAAALAAV